MRELSGILEFVRRIGEGERRTPAEWAELYGVKPVTVYRWAAEARHLGADLALAKGKYVIANWPQIGPRVERWLALEREQETLFDEPGGCGNTR